jgi:hypothetical protein
MFLFGGLKKTDHRNIEGSEQNRPLRLSFCEFLGTIQDPLFNVTERQNVYNSRLFFAIYSFALLVESTICGKVNITL